DRRGGAHDLGDDPVDEIRKVSVLRRRRRTPPPLLRPAGEGGTACKASGGVGASRRHVPRLQAGCVEPAPRVRPRCAAALTTLRPRRPGRRPPPPPPPPGPGGGGRTARKGGGGVGSSRRHVPRLQAGCVEPAPRVRPRCAAALTTLRPRRPGRRPTIPR